MGRKKQLKGKEKESYEYVITAHPKTPPPFSMALPTRKAALREKARLLKNHPNIKVSQPKKQKARNLIA